MSILSASVISLPFIILTAWMITDAYLEYDRFERVAGRGRVPHFNVDIMHMYLKNALKRMYICSTAPEMPENDDLPTMQISIVRENLAALNSDLPKSGKSQTYRAYVRYGGRSYTVKARYMGDNYWHWLYPQKSWRIRARKRKLIAQSRKLNIKNPRTILTFNECIAQDLAKEIGLIAPRVFPVKLIVNNIYMGVHLFWDPIDESVIRRFNRMPGSVYSGDGARRDPKTGVSLLWRDQKWWAKSASRSAEQKDYRGDLEILLAAVNNDDLNSFYDFANKHLDKHKYASFLSLDNLAACMHHDFHHNNKFYFDQITGKFEPVSWDIDLWHLRSPAFDATGSPLLNKWKLIPEFDLLRHRRLCDLLNSEVFSLDSIVQRIDELDSKVRPALEADVYRDAKANYYQANKVLKISSLPCVPFRMKHYDEAVRLFKEQIGARIKMLRTYLGQSNMTCALSDAKGILNDKQMRLIVGGNVGRHITGITLSGTAKSIKIVKDINRNQSVDEQDIVLGEVRCAQGDGFIALNELVLPGYKKVPLAARFPRLTFGNYGLEPSPIAYDYIIRARDGVVNSVKIQSQNVVTGEPMETSYGPIPEGATAETVSLHPWDLYRKAEKTSVALGPGEVTMLETVVYPEHVFLTIAPGTTIRLAEGVSIFCSGKVTASGTADNPIRFEAIDQREPWGVFALQGKGASESVFEYCLWEGGSHTEKELIYYCGMVSMHDVDDLVIRNCGIGRNYVGDDGLHLAYCKDFIVDGCLFIGAKSDAFDSDISQGEVVSSRFMNCGNDALDLMTSKVLVKDCVFDTTGDKGISVGEMSELTVDGCVFERCNIGIEIKDNSVVHFAINVIRNSPLAIHLYKKNWRYDGGGLLEAGTIYAVNCRETLKTDKNSKAVYDVIENFGPDLMVWREASARAGSFAPNAHNNNK